MTTVEAAGNVEAGAAKAKELCANCHGEGGNSTIALYPKLAGQQELYFSNALKSYQEGGSRQHEVKRQLLKLMSLTDEDIANIAAYYAAQTPSCK